LCVLFSRKSLGRGIILVYDATLKDGLTLLLAAEKLLFLKP
jgi:hypothetical protein